jgi:hypothetical protein
LSIYSDETAWDFASNLPVARQGQIMENVPGAVVDVHYAHAGKFQHAIEWSEVFFNEANEVERIVLRASFSRRFDQFPRIEVKDGKIGAG